MLIGNKNSFAIEYDLTYEENSFTYAKFRLWIHGTFIGVYEDESPTAPFYLGMEYIYKRFEYIKINPAP